MPTVGTADPGTARAEQPALQVGAHLALYVLTQATEARLELLLVHGQQRLEVIDEDPVQRRTSRISRSVDRRRSADGDERTIVAASALKPRCIATRDRGLGAPG